MPSKYTNRLSGQRILIVGGTSGIGFCVAENALEQGATVVVASSRQTSVDNTLSRLDESYPELKDKVSGHVVDVNSSNYEEQIIHILEAATNGGKDLLDHIVITAGSPPAIVPIEEFAGAEALHSAQRIRILVPLLFAKHAPRKYLRVSNRSSMTFTAGVTRPKKNFYLLSILRRAMEGMTEALAVDLQPIRVNLVLPGAVETELFSKRMSSEQMEDFKKTFKDEALTGVIGKPEDVSEVFLYAMKDGNVTAQSLYTDGGVLFAPGARS